MALFDKKFCDICGEKIGLLGNRKLEDGNLCKDCAHRLSPFMTDRRQSTVEDIRRHLAYREANRQQVADFRPTRQYGEQTRLYVDDSSGRFMVTAARDWQAANPDVIERSQVTRCEIRVDEHRTELYQKTADGKRVSYQPPRYEYDYAFQIEIFVQSEWFSEIHFELSSGNRPDSRYSDLYRHYEQQAYELRMALTGQAPAGAYGAAMPRRMQCDKCGWVPADPNQMPKFCPQCGDAIDAADLK